VPIDDAAGHARAPFFGGTGILQESDPFMAEDLHESRDPNLRFIVKELLKKKSRRRRGARAESIVRSIGRLLARNDGQVFDGLRLVAEDPVEGCRQWSVRKVS
jgi:hypothetical protein